MATIATQDGQQGKSQPTGQESARFKRLLASDNAMRETGAITKQASLLYSTRIIRTGRPCQE